MTDKTANNFLMDIDSIRAEVIFIATRSRGPGGQNVNKVSSAAQLYWDFENSNQLTIEQKQLLHKHLANFINNENQFYLRSDEFRDLERNKTRCLEKLQLLLEKAFHKPKPRKPSKPTPASKLRKKKLKRRKKRKRKKKQFKKKRGRNLKI